MKKKLIILVVLIIGITLLFSKIIKADKEEFKKEAFKAEKILKKPAGIQAYTLEGKNTDISYSDLIKNYEIDGITCKNGTIATYNEATNEVSLSNVHIPDYCTMNFKERKTIALYSKLLEDNPTISTRTDFSTPFTTNTANTLYKATENGTDVYYFAGQDTESTPINNWVKFGKNSSNQDLYWRIIRTNSDGSIRLLYHGTSTVATDAYIGESEFNANYDSPKYVGYMYGNSDTTLEEARANTNDSTIKTYIDSWYENNLTTYTNYLSNDAIYCNDRELRSRRSYSTTEEFNFKAYERLDINETPTYDCTNSKDAFSGNNNEAKLKYPIALMTADEIAYAGGVYNQEAPMWYYTNSSLESSTGTQWWWSLSPNYWNGFNAGSWFVNGSDNPGDLNVNFVGDCFSVRPAVSLKVCIKYSTGNGTSETPYEIVETSSGTPLT